MERALGRSLNFCPVNSYIAARNLSVPVFQITFQLKVRVRLRQRACEADAVPHRRSSPPLPLW